MSHLVALTKRRVPDVAFFDDGGDTTVTVEKPAEPIPQPAPAPRPETPEAPSFNFTPPTVERNPALTAAQDHAIKAMNGQLPVPEALTIDLDRQQGILIQSLAKTLGSGWRTSAPGMQALAEFKSRRTAAEDTARHGNPATTNTILQGLVQEDAFKNRAALEAFQAEVQSGLELYKAQLAEGMQTAQLDMQSELERARIAATNAGRTTTQTRTGSGTPLTALGGPIGGIAGMAAAGAMLSNKKPWWMPDSEKSGGTSSGVISPGFGEGGYSLTGLSEARFLDQAGGYSLFDSPGATGLDMGSTVDYGLGDLSRFVSAYAPGGTSPDFNFDSLLGDMGTLNYGQLWDPGQFNLTAQNYGQWFDPNMFNFDLGGLDLGGWGGLDLGSLDFSMSDLGGNWGYL